MITSRRTLGTSLVILGLVLVWSGRVFAIGPTVMMFYGAPLQKPVLVTGADTAPFGNLLAQTDVAASDIVGRTPISVALFWGPSSNPANNGVPLADLKPEMAWQHGRYYPATPTKSAVLLVTAMSQKATQAMPPPTAGPSTFSWGGALVPDAIAVLKRLGIPTSTAR